MPKTHLPVGMDVTNTLLKLCKRHPTEEVVQWAKSWVVFMEESIAKSTQIYGSEVEE